MTVQVGKGGALLRMQSAMEYLMTYGWAILVIAIVLGVMYALGVFNGINTVPRAQPGTCSIFRPNGPGTSYDVNFQGECQPQLPEFVAQFNGGATTAIILPASVNTLVYNANAFTGTAWFYASNTLGGDIFGGDVNGGTQQAIGFNIGLIWQNFGGGSFTTVTTILANQWYFVALSGNGGNGQVTLISQTGVTQTFPFTYIGYVGYFQNQIQIGEGYNQGGNGYRNFNGLLADVQYYNASLSQAEVTALYEEGIGGAPVRPQNLVGWWPLNGNGNDYSGNNNNGQGMNVHYVSNWTSSYTGPGAP